MNCKACRSTFGALPEKLRPKCEKVDPEKGTCPKGVPVLTFANMDAWLIYTSLLTQSVDGYTGLAKYDGSLVKDLADLFEVGGERRHSVFGKVLFMIGEVNTIRLEKSAAHKT